mmetsp:Transcript_4194/g.11943  ORF Transcript_4194/g.11943 Transcript_4194/m.11943 type:complete len:162 (+) Transcript_4194:60-545(+)
MMLWMCCQPAAGCHDHASTQIVVPLPSNAPEDLTERVKEQVEVLLEEPVESLEPPDPAPTDCDDSPQEFHADSPQELHVVMSKPHGAGVGLDTVGLRDPARIEVRRVREQGLVQRWNAAHPGDAVREGDVITAVNGESRDVGKMYETIVASETLALSIVRR